MSNSVVLPLSHEPRVIQALKERLYQQCGWKKEREIRTETIKGKKEEDIEIQKTVTLTAVEYVDKYFPTILDAIQKVNSLEETQEQLYGKDLDHFLIPKEFSHLVIPNSVRYDSSYRRMPDLLVRGDVKSIGDDRTNDAKYVEYLKCVEAIREGARVSGGATEDMVTLRSLKTNLSFPDVQNIIGTEGMCHQSDDSYFPLRISGDYTSLLGASWYGEDEITMVGNFYAYWYVKSNG